MIAMRMVTSQYNNLRCSICHGEVLVSTTDILALDLSTSIVRLFKWWWLPDFLYLAALGFGVVLVGPSVSLSLWPCSLLLQQQSLNNKILRLFPQQGINMQQRLVKLRGPQQGSIWHPQHTQPQHIPSSSWLQSIQGQHPDCLLKHTNPSICFSLSRVKHMQSKAQQLMMINAIERLRFDEWIWTKVLDDPHAEVPKCRRAR